MPEAANARKPTWMQRAEIQVAVKMLCITAKLVVAMRLAASGFATASLSFNSATVVFS